MSKFEVDIEILKHGLKVLAKEPPSSDLKGFFPNHEVLIPGETYTIDDYKILSCVTYVTLMEFPDKKFNSASFWMFQETKRPPMPFRRSFVMIFKTPYGDDIPTRHDMVERIKEVIPDLEIDYIASIGKGEGWKE